MAESSAIWFCGVEPTWQFFAAPLLPLRCYFSASITRSDMEAAGVRIFDTEDQCDCIPSPPAPASPPSEIYFCGLPAVQQFFPKQLVPTQCYYSWKLTRIQVMSQGVDVFEELENCQCVSPPPPVPQPPPPLALVPVLLPVTRFPMLLFMSLSMLGCFG